ncbi:MAG TPA: hypothetical protein VM431_12185 [Phycisphaerae bacterium]|nr:hypothetical protein [Phycisphaerae bacterium]
MRYAMTATVPLGTLLASGAARAAAEAPASFTDADYAAHLAALRKKVPQEGFTIVLEKPFFVVGDEAPAMVRRRAVNTVRWAVERLKRDFFKKDPTEILDIGLFKDKASYEKHAPAIFGDTPDTPFGYYSDRHRALVMNIATGGGTLVHEIVHPFMAANFPACPAWFNEGMGSLYEQSSDRGGHIVGLTNWRLDGLQKAVRAGRVPPFKDLTSTTDDAFYHKDKGTHYAQARYLCPTGYKTLQEVLGLKFP